MPTLTQVDTEHRARLMARVDALPALVDGIDAADPAALRERLSSEHAFLLATLVPHMEAIETGIHRELDRLLSCRLSMEPMEREHKEVRKLIGQLGDFAGRPSLSEPEKVELSRVVVKLYSILKVHLREESMYIPILERNLEPAQLDALVASMEHAGHVEL